MDRCTFKSGFWYSGRSLFYCFCGSILDSCREHLVALDGEACSFCWEPESVSCVSIF
jgi:hypothetical protein